MNSIAAALFDKDTITRPGAWTLTMLLGSNALTAVARCAVGSDRIVCQRFGFDPALASSAVRAVEEVVYANPLLLGDFRRVHCLVATDRFLPVAAPEAVAKAVAGRLWADSKPELVVSEIAGGTLAMGLDPHLAGFLSRSFSHPTICHRLVPLAKYFGHAHRMGNRGKLYLNLGEDELDAIAFGENGELSLLNTYAAPTPDDALYFALLAARTARISLVEGEIIVAGAPGERREEFTTKLRTYAATVLPMIFPSEILRVNQSMLAAPFELTASIIMADSQ